MAEPPEPRPDPRPDPRKVAAGRCTICRRPVDPQFRPFCSARCKQVDLGRWLDGRYAIPGDPPGDGGDDPAGG